MGATSRNKISFLYAVHYSSVYLFKAFIGSVYITSAWMLILCHKSLIEPKLF